MSVSNLLQNQAAVQQIAEVIASVLAVEVTIADECLRRIAGTGRFAGSLGSQLDPYSAFGRVLRDRQGVVIANPGEDSACTTCEWKENCPERAEVCCPILLDGKSIGIIALVAFDDSQRRSLLAQPSRLLDFLERMADLIANKVREQEQALLLRTMQQQMTAIINTVREGIVAVDRAGRIITVNAAAAGMLREDPEQAIGKPLADYLPAIPAARLLAEEKEWDHRETYRVHDGRKTYYIATTRLWREDGAVRGMVVTLREMDDVRRLISNVSTPDNAYTFDMILGQSPVLMTAKREAALAAAGSSTVLILGESGTGKELFARAIHGASDRKNKSLVAINCAAIPESLLESELFGYEEGAFTGAKRGGKPGKFELADGGTVFLDEIGDLSLNMQAKLLRVLQERRIERVGGAGSVPVDVRIIAATHKDVEEMVRVGEFRQDLFYRINVFPLRVPPLRERPDDLPLLIDVFFRKNCKLLNKELVGFEEAALDCLRRYSWPGNIRELENTVEYLVNIETGRLISASRLPERIRRNRDRTPETSSTGELTTIAELERQAIAKALRTYGRSVVGKEQAARALGISKATLYRKLKEYDLVVESF